MEAIFDWLRINEALSGWAQFAGAMIALFVTYRLASLPHRYRSKQLQNSAQRLLMNGYEVLESFHRTSGYFLPRAINLRVGALSMVEVANEIDRFPIFELPDQGSQSFARNLGAVGKLLKLTNLMLEDEAQRLGNETATPEERDTLRALVEGQMNLVKDILQGKPLVRPEFPAEATM